MKSLARLVASRLVVTLALLMCGAQAVRAQSAQVVPLAPITITGAATAAQFSANGQARWCLVFAPSSNVSTVQFGPSTVTATVGVPISPGQSMFLPTLAADTRESTGQHLYLLSAWYVYVASGDKAVIQCAN